MANNGVKMSDFTQLSQVANGDKIIMLHNGNAQADYSVVANAIINKMKSENVVTTQTNNNSKIPSAGLVYGMNETIEDLQESTSTEQEEKTVTSEVVSISDGGTDAEVILNIEPHQSGSGDPSPDNVRPITGWTGAKVTRTGKNLFRLGWMAQTMSQNGITVTPYNDIAVKINGTNAGNAFDVQFDFGAWGSTPLRLKKQASDYKITYSVKINGTISGSYSFYAGYFDKNGVAHQFKISNSTLVWTGTIPADATKLRTWMVIPQDASASDAIIEIQAELGSTATAYEPYQGETYDITFPTEAGTVYGGTLDVTKGELTVDMAIVDMGTLDWMYYSTQKRIVAQINSGKPAMDNVGLDGVCSVYKVVNTSYRLAPDKSIIIGNNFISNPIAAMVVHDEDYTDVETFKTAVSGQTLVFPIKTPVTYQLTSHEIYLLANYNSIWMDVDGTITLNYKDNAVATKGDVGEVRGELHELAKALEMIAPVETSYTATRNYTVGSFLIVGTTLYKVTTAIANGGAITPNTNVTATTIAEQLIALASA